MSFATLASPVLALALALPQATGPGDGDAPVFTFSDGPFERAWALVDPAAAPSPLAPERLPPADEARRESRPTWERWASSLRAVAEQGSAPAERLWLAAFAREQGRFDDAWEHLAHAADDPGGLRATLPLMIPGVEAGSLGAWPRLEDGALLAPALPPPDRAADEIVLGTGRVRRGWSRVEGFRVGDAIVALSVKVEGDGVQVDLEHLGGGPARVRLLLPEPPDFELSSEYLDWGRLDGVRRAREVALEPGGEARTLFGRYQPRRLEWPVLTPPALGAQLERDGLLLVSEPDEPLEGLASGLQALLGLRVEVRSAAPQAPLEPFAGVRVDLRDPGTFAAKRAALVGTAERFALSRPR